MPDFDTKLQSPRPPITLLSPGPFVPLVMPPLLFGTDEPHSRWSAYLDERGYEVLHVLGQGAYGTVLKARDKRTEMIVAVKVFHGGEIDTTTLKWEVETLRLAEGSVGVIGLKEIALDADPPYFAMQYAPNGSLESYLSDLHSTEEVVRVFEQIARTMAFVHRLPIVHCDLKPANILLNEVEDTLIADFGQARLVNNSSGSSGTFFYMAPEAALTGAPLDPRWDIYSLGAILYALIIGRPPHYTPRLWEYFYLDAKQNGGSAAEYYKFLKKTPPPVDHWRLVDRRLAEIVDSCLRFHPEERPESLRVVQERLQRRAQWLGHRRVWVRIESVSRQTTLAQFVARNGPLDANLAATVFRQIVDAVDRLHAQGIRHRDLRPENVLLAGNDADNLPGPVKNSVALRSFTPEAPLGLDASSLPYTPPEQTTTGRLYIPTGETVTDLAYSPPAETATNLPNISSVQPTTDPTAGGATLVDFVISDLLRGDIYSLGALLYFMLTGRPPHDEVIPEAIHGADGDIEAQLTVYREQRELAAPPTLHHAKADRDLASLVDDCLQFAPDDRPESTRALLHRLDRRSHWLGHRRVWVRHPSIGAAATLSEYVARHGPLGRNLAGEVFRQVVDAIDRMHAQGLCHGDLRPENVVLAGDDRTDPAFPDAPMGLDAGRLDYSPPERATTHRLPAGSDGRQDDLYSLGTLLHFMLTGSPPHNIDVKEILSSGSELEQHLERYRERRAVAPPPTRHHAAADWDLASLVDLCLRPDPSDRPESTRALLNRIDRRERWRKNRPAVHNLLWIAAAVVLTMAVVGVFTSLYFVREARKSRTEQAFLANAELISITELVLRDKLKQPVRTVKVAAERAKADPTSLLPDLETLRSELSLLCNAVDSDRRFEVLRRSHPRFGRWLKDFYEQELGHDNPVLPVVTIYVVPRDPAGRAHAFIAGRVLDTNPDNPGAPIAFDERFQMPLGERPELRAESKANLCRDWFFRDYFHGRGKDLTQESDESPEPVARTSVSAAYISNAPPYYNWMLEISTPVHNAKGEVVALITTGVKVADSSPEERTGVGLPSEAATDLTNPGLVSYWSKVCGLRKLVVLDERTGAITIEGHSPGWFAPGSDPETTPRPSPEWLALPVEKRTPFRADRYQNYFHPRSEETGVGKTTDFIDPVYGDGYPIVGSWRRFDPLTDDDQKDGEPGPLRPGRDRTILVQTSGRAVGKPVNDLYFELAVTGTLSMLGLGLVASWVLYGIYRQMRYGVPIRLLPWRSRRAETRE